MVTHPDGSNTKESCLWSQESQVALIKELLNDEDARNRLKEKEVKLLTQISHCQQVIVNSPVKR